MLQILLETGYRNTSAVTYRELAKQYLAACTDLAPTSRLALLDRLSAGFAERDLPIAVFTPFIYADDNHEIAIAAVQRTAQHWPQGAYATDDFAAVMRDELALLVDLGEAERASAILASLLHLGDRRLIVRLHGTWRYFGRKGRRYLCRRLVHTAQAPVLEWLTSWLAEARSEREARDVAGTLISAGQVRWFDAVYEVRREDASSGTFTVKRHWLYATFGKRLEARWKRMPAEHVPQELYTAWGSQAPQ